MLGGPSPEELLKNVLLPGAKCSYRVCRKRYKQILSVKVHHSAVI